MSDRIFIINDRRHQPVFRGTLEQFAKTFAAYGTITKQDQIIDLCVDWDCNLFWTLPDSELIDRTERLRYKPEGLFIVGVLEGRKVVDGTKLYDIASGLEVIVVNSQQAVALNADGEVYYCAWRKNGCWTFTTPDTWPRDDEEDDPDLTNTEDLHIVGYANRTALHPVGSYIGFEPGPTVFATPVVYLSEAQEKIDALNDRIEELEEDLRKALAMIPS